MTLPPGQHAIKGFPRFGAEQGRPPPPVPADPVIEISGAALTKPFTLPLAALATLPRQELTADFHCVAGWSATDLRWEGVAFATFYRAIVEPLVRPGATVTHVVFVGLDGFRSVVRREDALAENVLIAERLDGRPLGGDHGAPARVVSPDQYGYISTKYLCRIELHTAPPGAHYHEVPVIDLQLRVLAPHPRARVWEEERHRFIPGWALRNVYRFVSGRISKRTRA